MKSKILITETFKISYFEFMKVYLAADHGGFQLKEELKVYLCELGYEVEDMGTYQLNPTDDYPDFILPTAKKVAGDPASIGIVLGRSGNGEAIAANKVKGIRAAVCLNEKMAQKAREHNHANILALGVDFVSLELAKIIAKTFLETGWLSEDRHTRRINKIIQYEEENTAASS